MFALNLGAWAPPAIARGLVTDDETTALTHELPALAGQPPNRPPGVITGTMHQCALRNTTIR